MTIERTDAERAVRLGRCYQIAELRPEWLRFLRGRPLEYGLPTQVVFDRAGFYMPRMARAYVTDYWCVGRQERRVVLSREHLDESKGRLGLRPNHALEEHPSSPAELLLAEVWENGGEDGHRDYMLDGMLFVEREKFESLVGACGYVAAMGQLRVGSYP